MNGLADATGSLTAQTAYDSFGNQSASLPTRYGFTGRERDDFTGLLHYRARHYDPKLGRRVSGFLHFFFRGSRKHLIVRIPPSPTVPVRGSVRAHVLRRGLHQFRRLRRLRRVESDVKPSLTVGPLTRGFRIHRSAFPIWLSPPSRSGY